jgi:hypothetical protein
MVNLNAVCDIVAGNISVDIIYSTETDENNRVLKPAKGNYFPPNLFNIN